MCNSDHDTSFSIVTDMVGGVSMKTLHSEIVDALFVCGMFVEDREELADRILKLVEERLPKTRDLHLEADYLQSPEPEARHNFGYNQAITDMKKGLGL
jgi:hypothetical protein